MFLKDSRGLTFSTNMLITLFIIILVFGAIVNIIDISSEKTMNSLEVEEIERITNEIVDILINNPGTPKHWEKLYDFNIVNPGLSIENSSEVNDEEFYLNTVSFKKLQILKNGEYENLITKKLFKNKMKSSISIYPINSNIDPIIISDDFNNYETSSSNIIAVNRTVRCDFYSDLSIISVSNIDKINSKANSKNNFKNNSENSFKINNNLYNNLDLCNHRNIEKNEHFDDEKYEWICKGFKLNKNDFEEKNYYIVFNENSVNKENYWVLDTIKNHSNDEKIINSNKINLNDHLNQFFENENSMIFYLHSKINKDNIDKYEYVLIGVPKDLDISSFNIDYFKDQDCYFIMRSYYDEN